MVINHRLLGLMAERTKTGGKETISTLIKRDGMSLAEAVVPATKPPAISAAAPVAVTPGAGRIKPEVIRAYQPLLNSESLMGL